MSTYCVRVHGANFLMKVEPEPPRRYGFYINWVLDARDAEHAGRAAIESVASSPRLQRAQLNTVDDPPSFWIEDIVATPGEPVPTTQQGFIFFPEDPDEEIANRAV